MDKKDDRIIVNNLNILEQTQLLSPTTTSPHYGLRSDDGDFELSGKSSSPTSSSHSTKCCKGEQCFSVTLLILGIGMFVAGVVITIAPSKKLSHGTNIFFIVGGAILAILGALSYWYSNRLTREIEIANNQQQENVIHHTALISPRR
jgi:hypothetical protein